MAINDSNGMNSGDILSQLTSSQSAQQNNPPNSPPSNREIQLLESIDKSVKDILKNSTGMSQSNASSRIFNSRQSINRNTSINNIFSSRRHSNGLIDDFTTAFQKTIFEAFLGSDFKSKIQDVMSKLAHDIGVNVEDIPSALGEQLAKDVFDKFKKTSVGQKATDKINNLKDKGTEYFKTKYTSGRDAYMQAHGISPSRREESSDKINPSQSQSQARANSPKESRMANDIEKIDSIIIHAQSVTVIKDSKQESTTGPQESDASKLPSESNQQSSGSDALNADSVRSFLSDKFGDEALSSISDDAMKELVEKLAGGNLDDVTSVVSKLFGDSANAGGVAESLLGKFASGGGVAEAGAGLGALGSEAAGAGAALAGLESIAAAAGPVILAAVVALEAFSPAIESGIKLIKKSIDVADRYEKSRQENMKSAQNRLTADVRVMVETPFKILEEAADEMCRVWDNNLRIINATQGYNKDDLQTLIGNYAQRLRDEGLTKVVSASSITESLTKVLQSGLSGTIAEEFAYLATKLNAAIPTQDFFSYADTYASIAATAVQQGMSEAKAIEYANSQLEAFANNLLYASREISGGFTTGLKDANSLFAESAQIAQAGKTNDSSEISAVMTAVASYVGSIAPDLSSSLTDAIYKASVGGNSSEIIALRSLAGINASNTEFLKQISENPQSVFETLFTNLGNMQKMSEDAYMEVAEGLSNIFGVSSDAFARVDFNYLAQAISSMNSSSDALSENMALLVSGETTTNAEQLKMQQINEYMLEEGLSYVLDNEAARSIQENMWAEQRAQQIMENEYGVSLRGSALEFLEGIRKTLDNIMMLLNPVGIKGKISAGLSNLIGSAKETEAQSDDIKQLLELGKVGNGNKSSLYQLTTRGINLNTTEDLISLMGGSSSYQSVSKERNENVNFYTPWNSIFDTMTNRYGVSTNAIHAAKSTFGFNSSRISSLYNWGAVGKSSAGYTTTSSGKEILGLSLLRAEAASGNAQSSASSKAANSNIQKFLGTMDAFLKENTGDDASYEDWVKTASRFGISDFSEALKDAGLTNEAVKGQFEAFQTEVGIQAKKEREQREDQFWIDNIENLTAANTWFESIYNKQSEFFDDFLLFHKDFLEYGGKDGKFDSYQKAFDAYCQSWTDYYVNHTAYKTAVGYDSSSWSKVRSAEESKSRDAVYALADALTKNNVDLLDPTVQTNVLLAEILQIVNAIMQQGNSASGGVSLPQSISAMALGIANV